ncbi:TonB-dependent receptor family protein [uncultured Bacteroides sp.]|jgi:hypothetical protein|uniref:TonB-dependent receptor family protein n=1 Tax=uncultured Bacteroides sp. TaxID=162156 RepID=UPI00280A6982|nr:TonB-dependent receptor family protein [uncultured Bacteroides sp.]
MKMLKKVILSMLACQSILAGLSAQTLSGKLVDEKNIPLSYANVVLLALPDSAFVTGTTSGEDGAFSLNAVTENRIVRISSIGYTTMYRPVSSADMGVIQLTSDAQLLNEVTVKADLPKMRLKGDAMITTVAGSVLEKSGTGNDLLDKIPGVSAEDGAVNVFGRGAAEIYINGRKMRNSSELDRLSSDNVKSVEVVRNPGARYDASVKAVVRIFTKKPQGEGFGFDNRFLSRHRRTYGWTLFDQFNFNYRKGGFDLSGTLIGSNFRGGNNQQMTFDTHLDKLWQQKMDGTYAKTENSNVGGALSMNYQFNDKHSMGVRYDIDRYMNTFGDWRYLTQVFSDGQLYEKSESRMLLYDPSTCHNLNYYYNGQLGNWSIDFNADGLWSPTEEAQHTTEIVDGGTENHINTFNENKSTLYAAKLILSHPLWQGNLSFGGEYSHTNRTNLYLNTEGILADDNSRIKEGAVSAFADYARSFGSVSVQAGVRYEHVAFDYYEQDKRIDVQSRKFDNVFPSLNINFPVGKVQIQFSYAGDITRPSYDNLRNSTYYANRYTYQTGNPFLTPTITQNVMLASSYKWLNFSVGYSRVKDDIMQMSEAYSDDNPTISLLTVVNTDSYDRLTASLTLAPTIGLWKPQFSAELYKQWFSLEGYNGRISLSNPYVTLVWRNNFSLPAGILFDANAVCTTRGHTQNMYMRRVSCDVSLSLYKAFFKDRLSVQLQASNLLETNDVDAVIYSGIRTMGDYISEFRRVSLTLRYKFNAAKSKYRGAGAGDGQKSRL